MRPGESGGWKHCIIAALYDNTVHACCRTCIWALQLPEAHQRVGNSRLYSTRTHACMCMSGIWNGMGTVVHGLAQFGCLLELLQLSVAQAALRLWAHRASWQHACC